jgi:CHAT domain-containing protein
LVRAEMLNNISRDDSLLRQQNDLTKALFSIQDKLNREEENGEAAQNATIVLSREVVHLDRKIQMNKARIEERFPGYFKVKYPQIISLKDLQQTVLDSHEVILEYFWGNQNVYVIGITKEDFIFERLTAVDSISKAIDEFVVHFSTNASGLDINSFKSFSDASHHLYLQLIEPLKVFISGKSKIRVVPDGPISQVPFEVLITSSLAETATVNYKRLAYLIQDYTIGYAYSASMLKNESEGVLNKGSLFGMAFTAENNIKPASFDLPQLIGAGLELQALQKRFGSGKFLKGGNVTETNFKRFAPEYDIIHLAVHGKGDVDVNASSSLFFTSAGDSLEDGELHAYELYGLKLKARLAVLTSCESGLGKLYKGEGMMSMASGFAYSGCANTLMSLWKVTDQSSVELVDHFYDQLLKGRTIDEALRESKLRYLSEADEFTADPKFWASLVVYGSHDPVFEEKRSNIILIVFFIVAILLLLIFVIRRRMLYRLLRPFVTVHH